MKKLYSCISSIFCLAAALLTGNCTADNEGTAESPQGTAITLSATVEGQNTRAGSTGVIDYSTLATANYGFGVFSSSASDGFTSWLDNTKVSYNGSESPTVANPEDLYLYPRNWTYGDTKYWKEDTKISFYAYAPYVSAGSGTGITAVSSNTAGDPTVTYTIATTPDAGVDLLWGINGDTGLPWTDATLKQTGGPILFTFRHALAAIGFHVQAIIDQDNNTADLTDESEVANLLGESGHYKITVKNLTISGNFPKTATLNLNNSTANTPNWGTATDTESTLTVGNSLINAAFRHPNESTTTDATTAQSIVTGSLTGITQTAQQLLIANNAAGKEQCFFVIPNTEQDYTYTVTLNWCISGQAADGTTYVAEDRTSTISVSDLALQAGFKYYLNFVVGLRTLRLDVTATDWTNTPVPANVTIEHGTSANSSLAPLRQQNK